jgi:hypothetical protein
MLFANISYSSFANEMNAFEAAEKNGKAANLRQEVEALFITENKSTTDSTTSIPVIFIRVPVIR